MHSRQEKMKDFLRTIRMSWESGVIDTFIFSSMDYALQQQPENVPLLIRLCDSIPPDQQAQLLAIARDEYKILTFTEKPLFQTSEEVIKTLLHDKDIHEYRNNKEFERAFLHLLAQKEFTITVNDNFDGFVSDLLSEKDGSFKITLYFGNEASPVLYANKIPIHKFQSNDNYLYKLMSLALKAKNGTRISSTDILDGNKRNRGCSQDLSDIFISPIVKDVFAREITNDGFVIYHTITKNDLKAVSSFQKSKPKDAQDTKYLLDLIKESRFYSNK